MRQATYTVHEISENEVITKENIEEMIYARRVKDNKFLTQVLIAASVVCFWWPFSLICLAAAYYTSEKVHYINFIFSFQVMFSSDSCNSCIIIIVNLHVASYWRLYHVSIVFFFFFYR